MTITIESHNTVQSNISNFFRHVLKYIVPFFVAAVLNTYAYARGLAKISASAAGVLIGLGPVVVFIESLIILKEKFLIRKVRVKKSFSLNKSANACIISEQQQYYRK